jgi:squalene-hopene/tetraprenyl-beta-curcumene cyclase
MGLVHGGEADSDACRRGVEHLIGTQTDEGTWEEPWFTGTGFPRVFYLRYDLYRHYFPLWALGQYRERRNR